MGHVQAIQPGRITLEGGVSDIDGSALYIDCTADGFAHRQPTPVFSDGHISLQAVRTCQPAFSAAVIAHVEAAYPDDETRNAFCHPVPYPSEPADWLRMMLAFNKNQLQWFSDPDMMGWVDRSRLNVLPRFRRGQRPGARKGHLHADLPATRHQRQAGNAAHTLIAGSSRSRFHSRLRRADSDEISSATAHTPHNTMIACHSR